jgi:DNA modification methylase
MQLFNDDCLKVLPTIPDKSIDLILTDPPYGTTQCKSNYYKQLIPRDELGKKRLKNKNNPIRFKGNNITGSIKSKNYDINRYNENYKNPSSVLNFKINRGKLHPTQKPVALLEYLIKTYTNENDTVLDFTMGSGSTGVACKNLNRNFIGIEKDDKYFDIAKQLN